jgi:hypothetical protein
MKKIIFLFGISFILSACGNSEPPVKIETYTTENPFWDGIKNIHVKVTSVVDEVTIDKVIVNRGNCKATTKMSETLKFGQSFSVAFSPSCKEVIQIDVVTNQGDWSISY